MKKIFTLLVSAFFAATMSATDYTGPLSVSLGGNTTPSGETTVSYTEGADGTCNLTLKNFSFLSMPIGTINLTEVELIKSPLVSVFSDDKQLIIDNGDDKNVSQWLGPSLGEMNIFVKGFVQNGKLNAVILIDMNASVGMIKVLFGEHADEVGQIPNSGFERFHTVKYSNATSQEPDGWHSFMSCDGNLSAFVAGTAHTDVSKDVRPGSTGTQSLKIFSTAVNLGLVKKSANGTITTGRLSAGSAKEDDPANHSYIDMSKTDVDAAGDPFCAAVTALPDSIEAWVKFEPGKEGITATMSAAITDGTYYQDPEDKTYNNVCGKASNSAIAANDGKWQLVKAPFDYSYLENDNEDLLTPKAILVTMSTCSVPGGGSTDSKKPDNLYIDDVRLVYNDVPTAIKYDGQPIPGFEAGKFEYDLNGTEDFNVEKLDEDVKSIGYDTSVSVVSGENGAATVYYTIISGDYQNALTYTINYTKGATGINSAKTGTSNKVAGVYDLSGRLVKYNGQHGVYIVRTADGKTFKINK